VVFGLVTATAVNVLDGLVGRVAAGLLGALALRFGIRRALVEPHWLQVLTVVG
jgi:hypothetical protein